MKILNFSYIDLDNEEADIDNDANLQYAFKERYSDESKENSVLKIKVKFT